MLTSNARNSAASTGSLGLLRYIPSLYQVALVAVLGAVFIVALAPRVDTDFWWHLKVGQYIALHHLVPAHDFMSFTLVGHAWTDHEWLAEITMYGLYQLAGLWGPIGFFAVIICATFFLVYWRIAAFRVNRVLALFIVSASFVASSASWGPRIQMMTLFFLASYLVVLRQFELTHKRRWLVLFPALMLIWANVHGGFVLGLVVLVVSLAGEYLNRRTYHPDAWSMADLQALGIATIGTAAVTIINPNGFRQLLYPLTFVLPNAYTNLIEESASPNFHLPVMMLFEVMLLLLLAAAFVGRVRTNWTHLFLLLAFTHLALSQVRNVAVWAVVIGPYVALYLQSAAPALREQFPSFSYRRRPVRGRIGPLLNAALLILISFAYVLESTHFVNAVALKQAESQNFPRTAIAYLRTHDLKPRVFASYEWGGYLLWNLFPRYRDYMDSRADTLFTDRILRNYLTAYSARPGWQRVLKQYRVDDVLIPRSAPLAQVLAEDHGWKLVEKDSIAVLYAKR